MPGVGNGLPVSASVLGLTLGWESLDELIRLPRRGFVQ